MVGFGGYVSVPGYLAAWRRGPAMVIHEVNVPPGVANRLGHEVHQERRGGLPAPADAGRGAARRPGGRGAAAPRHRRAGPGRPCATPPGRTSGSAPTCRCCSWPAARRAPARSTWPSPGRPRSWPAAGVQVLHVIGARNEPVSIPTDLPVPYVTRAVPVRDGAGLRRRRPDAGPGRRDDLRRGGRDRPARHLRAATRTATRSRSATRCPWWRPAAGCSSTTPS